MAIVETQFAEIYQGNSQNYLNDYLRRTNQLGSTSYYVECLEDGTTGRPLYNIRPTSDLATNPSNDPSNPQPYNPTPSDPALVAETKTDI